jgi:type I restriction enzyme, R subunit
MRKEAVKPLLALKVRNLLTNLKTSYEQIIDTVSADRLLHAGFSGNAQEKAKETVESFRKFLDENRNEITALQILYSRPWKRRLTYKQVKELAAAIQRPHPAWTPEALWRAYEQLDGSKVRGSGHRVLTDLVSLVTYAIGSDAELQSYPEKVREQFQVWLSEQEQLGAKFSDEQLQWLNQIAEAYCDESGNYARRFRLRAVQ